MSAPPRRPGANRLAAVLFLLFVIALPTCAAYDLSLFSQSFADGNTDALNQHFGRRSLGGQNPTIVTYSYDPQAMYNQWPESAFRIMQSQSPCPQNNMGECLPSPEGLAGGDCRCSWP